MKSKFFLVVISILALFSCTPKGGESAASVDQSAIETQNIEGQNQQAPENGAVARTESNLTPGLVSAHAIEAWWAITEGMEEYYLLEGNAFVKCHSISSKNGWVLDIRMYTFTYELMDGRKGETLANVFKKVYEQGNVTYGVLWEVVYAERNPTQPCQMQSLCRVVNGAIVEKTELNKYNGKTFELVDFIGFGLDAIDTPTKLVAYVKHYFGLMGSDGGFSLGVYEIDLQKEKIEMQPIIGICGLGWDAYYKIPLLDNNNNPMCVNYYYPSEGERTIELLYDPSVHQSPVFYLYSPEVEPTAEIASYPVKQVQFAGGTRVYLDSEGKTSRYLEQDTTAELVQLDYEPYEPLLVKNGKLLFLLYRFRLQDGTIVYSTGDGLLIRYKQASE